MCFGQFILSNCREPFELKWETSLCKTNFFVGIQVLKSKKMISLHLWNLQWVFNSCIFLRLKETIHFLITGFSQKVAKAGIDHAYKGKLSFQLVLLMGTSGTFCLSRAIACLPYRRQWFSYQMTCLYPWPSDKLGKKLNKGNLRQKSSPCPRRVEMTFFEPCELCLSIFLWITSNTPQECYWVLLVGISSGIKRRWHLQECRL